jgi:hypothetical protein
VREKKGVIAVAASMSTGRGGEGEVCWEGGGGGLWRKEIQRGNVWRVG